MDWFEELVAISLGVGALALLYTVCSLAWLALDQALNVIR